MIAGTVQLGVQAWMFSNIPDMCSPNQKHGFVCPTVETTGTASIIWGVIGPQRVLSSGQIYFGEFSGFSDRTYRAPTNERLVRPHVFLPHWRTLPACCMAYFTQVAQQLGSLCEVSFCC